jgi:hypothetical protein
VRLTVDATPSGREVAPISWTEDELWALLLEEDTTTFLRAYPPDAAGRVEDGLVLTWRGSDGRTSGAAPLRRTDCWRPGAPERSRPGTI